MMIQQAAATQRPTMKPQTPVCNLLIESQIITNTSPTQTGTATLIENSGNNNNRVTTTLPPEISIKSKGFSGAKSPQEAKQFVTQLIQNLVRNSKQSNLLIQGVKNFKSRLPVTTNVDARSLTFSSNSEASQKPIIIIGTTSQPTNTSSGSNSDTNTGNTSSTTQTEAFVIDFTQMPTAAPTQLQLHSIDLAVIIGSALITGGTGSNVVHADDHPQSIVLGADDDTIHGGGGQDTIGSAAGNDLLSGGSGQDRITGGADNDTLQGGAQADILDGESGDDLLTGGKGRDTLHGPQATTPSKVASSTTSSKAARATTPSMAGKVMTPSLAETVPTPSTSHAVTTPSAISPSTMAMSSTLPNNTTSPYPARQPSPAHRRLPQHPHHNPQPLR